MPHNVPSTMGRYLQRHEERYRTMTTSNVKG